MQFQLELGDSSGAPALGDSSGAPAHDASDAHDVWTKTRAAARTTIGSTTNIGTTTIGSTPIGSTTIGSTPIGSTGSTGSIGSTGSTNSTTTTTNIGDTIVIRRLGILGAPPKGESQLRQEIKSRKHTATCQPARIVYVDVFEE